jgi:hypothetical protein
VFFKEMKLTKAQEISNKTISINNNTIPFPEKMIVLFEKEYKT